MDLFLSTTDAMFQMVESGSRVMENVTTISVCVEIVNVPSGGVECNITLPLIFVDSENAGMCMYTCLLELYM